MLRKIKVVPLAAESLGTRSMCTYVETPDTRILLDAGISLCPNRFGLPPHPREFKAIIEGRKRIAEAARRAETITLSHYHFDHHTPSYEDWVSQWTERTETARQIYEGKTVLIKNPRDHVNYSQRRRGWLFQTTSGKHAKRLEIADREMFLFGRTVVRFSEPVYHGPEDSMLGWVLMTTVEYEGEKFMFAPDVQGPISTQTLKKIVSQKPQLMMLGGPPLYLAGFRVDEREISAGLGNLKDIVGHVPLTILDHHIMRDEHWKEKSAQVFHEAYKSEHTVLTSAEFLKRKNSFLEASRKTLFEQDPPSKEFEKWMKEGIEVRKHLKPPV